jgi:molybdopterin/thiamine biosynthesis adenylyltransferase/rhodanese-related sulfurtransferase
VTTGYEDLVRRARSLVPEVAPADLADSASAPPVVVDIREADETATGTIPGAILVPRGVLEKAMPQIAPDPGSAVVLYCSVGNRSALAALVLREMGYTGVASLAGGIARWRLEQRPVQMPEGLPDPAVRYARHLVLPEIGAVGQQRLGEARVLVVGAGGLGSPAALYLAAAGIGTIGIVDSDVVDASNLQRQVLHDTGQIGRRKVESAAAMLARLNPGVVVETHPIRLDAGNVMEVAAGYELVVDGTDSFPVRYLLNDAVLHLGIPLVHGSVLRFEGQMTVVAPHQGPCYRCVFPAPPPPDLSPSCAEAGVLGAVPGVIGSLQAVEAVKVLLGIGEPLVGRLLVYDGLAAEVMVLTTTRDPHCPACGDPGSPPRIVDYDETCRPQR